MFTISISERVLLSGIVSSVLMVVLTLILGRFFCGWICPLGTTIDMVGNLRKKSPLRESTNSKLRLPKFIFLGAILFFCVLGVQMAWFFDPMVIMARFISLNLIPTITLVLDKISIVAIKVFGFNTGIYDFYRTLKSSVLGVHVYYFAHSGVIFLFFLTIVGASLALSRFWCRAICPLGAMYSFLANFSFLKRSIKSCNGCKKCRSNCRMGAIKDDLSYASGECILCMDCIYDCPENITQFKFRAFSNKRKNSIHLDEKGMSRRNFLLLLAVSSFSSLGFRYKPRAKWFISKLSIIRPPAALKEDDFLDRCIRCGNCMKVCITNGLQPAFLQTGFTGIWTPHLVPEIGYCEYQCTLCGSVCPTGAIRKVSVQEKKRVRLGFAQIDRSMCLPWADKTECIVCQEHCPVADKAIKLIREDLGDRVIFMPYVDRSLCVGCGICQNKCPVRPVRAVKVYPFKSRRIL
ncbi:4Fe-4S binding protein [Candidatus Omnitrophota bacterium]